MASGNYYSGKIGYVRVGGSDLAMDEWSFDMDAAVIKVTNFLSGGYQEVIAGIFSANVSFSGQWDAGNIGLVIGGTYSVVLGISPSVSLTGSILLSKLQAKDSTEGNPKLSCSGPTNGTFSILVV